MSMTPEQEANYRAALLRSREEFPEVYERIKRERQERAIDRLARKRELERRTSGD